MIPVELAWLFWDVDPGAIDLVRHRDYVIERIMRRSNQTSIIYPVSRSQAVPLARSTSGPTVSRSA